MADVRAPTGPSPLRVISGLTVRQLCEWLCDDEVTDDLVAWAPDVAALTCVLLERAHVYRFVVSPPAGAEWPPGGSRKFAADTAAAATQWRSAMDRGSTEIPPMVRSHWDVLMGQLDTPLADLASGRPWSACQAVLVLHAIADEASAGVAGGARRDGPGVIFRARARELLSRSGSMARLPTDRVVRLPKSRTTSVGITHRSVSRYGCSITDEIAVHWDRVPLRRGRAAPVARHANVLLLPWPLRIRESDFVPIPGSVRRPQREPFGFFEYRPSEPLDLDLVDRLIDAAAEEVDQVDVVVLPEGCLDEGGVAAIEALLARRGVPMLVTGVRPEPNGSEEFALNCLHVGVLVGDTWCHYRQNKHHRWFLDAGQIEAYNIAGALHPGVRWWEAMAIPQRNVQFLEVGGGMTVAAVVCEDLARLDGVAQLLRSVGPTLVVTLLLDGPQLASRWTARYASVLADDPGSTVLTLTALGMANRSRPVGHPPSRVVALWKDSRGMREIALDPGAQAVLLKAIVGRSVRHAADGRPPVDDVTDFTLAGVEQVVAAAPPLPARSMDVLPPGPDAILSATEISVVSGWADAICDAIHHGYCSVGDVIAEVGPEASWRGSVALPESTVQLSAALAALADVAATVVAGAGTTVGVRQLSQRVPHVVAGSDPVTQAVGLVLSASLQAMPTSVNA